MDFEVDCQLSSAADNLLEKLNIKFGSGRLSKISNAWLELFNYNFAGTNDPEEMEVENSAINSRDDIINLVKETLERNSTISDTVFKGLSVNEVNKILCVIKEFLDERKFSAFCNLIDSWDNGSLVEYALGSVILPKLQENSESSACIIYSVKQLAMSKPDYLSQNLIIPLLIDDTYNFTDFELLNEVFSVLPDSQKDLIILALSKKSDFHENDWQLVNPLIKYLSQNSLWILMDCILKFSNSFTKSQVFGRFLVNFCKHLELGGNKESLREVVEKHETLLKIQALKYLDLI